MMGKAIPPEGGAAFLAMTQARGILQRFGENEKIYVDKRRLRAA